MRQRLIPMALCMMFAGYGVSNAQSTHGASAQKAHWSYQVTDGPAKWAQLDRAFATCSSGSRQSPVDLSTTSFNTASAHISYSYAPASATIANNGHTIQASFAQGGTLHYNGKDYKLLQLHYHAPSEHTINGKQAAVETHMVHRAADGTLAVVGTLFDVGNHADSVVAALLRGARSASSALINPSTLITPDHSYFAYDGSLTTPPCSEGVKWIVLRGRRSITAEQLTALKHALGSNARPVMPLSGRKVVIAQ